MQKLPTLPNEIIVEIAKCHWRAWAALRVACKLLHGALSALNPYELFTQVYVDDTEDCYTTKHWTTCDGVNIRSIELMICGMTTVSYRGRKHIKFNYGSRPYIDDDDNYHPGTFTYDVIEYQPNGDKTTRHIEKAAWYQLVKPWDELFKRA